MGRVKLQGKARDFTSHTPHGRNPFISPFSSSFSTVCKSFSHSVDLSLGSSSLFASHSLRVSLGLVCVCGTKEKRRGMKGKEWRRREGGKGEKRKRKGKRGSEWDTCPIVGGWEEIILSFPTQSCADTWQGTLISNNSII
jgi:hypothetical protein